MSTDSASVRGHSPGSVRWGVVILAFLAVLLDGFDTASLAFVIPALSNEWGIDPSGFTLPLVLTNVGVVLGYLSSGSLGARLGTRTLLVSGVALFSITTLLTALALSSQSVPLLTVLRFPTGFGFGVVLPAAVSLATDHSPTRRRELVSVIVTLGLASGATVGGFFGGWLITTVGSAGVFWIAGSLPLALALAMKWSLPEARQSGSGDTAKQEARVGQLFTKALRGNTLLIWVFSLLVFISAYTLQSWVPTLLIDYGFTAAEAPLGIAYYSVGGILGGILLISLVTRIGIAPALIVLPLIGAVCTLIAARSALANVVLLLILGGAGLGITASQIGQLTMAVALYPMGTRTTGVGWAAALGRVGSIAGPGIAGLLLALGLSGKNIVLLTTLPVIAAALCAATLWRRLPRSSGVNPAAPERDPAPPEAEADRHG